MFAMYGLHLENNFCDMKPFCFLIDCVLLTKFQRFCFQIPLINYQRLEKELRSENLVIAIRESTQKEIGLSLTSICSNFLLLHFHLIKVFFEPNCLQSF